MKYFLILLAVPSISFGDCTASDLLPNLRPKAEWTMSGNKLEWLDKTQTKPTADEIDSAISACNQQKVADAESKLQAQIDLRTKTKTDAERIDAIIKYLGLEK